VQLKSFTQKLKFWRHLITLVSLQTWIISSVPV